MMSDKIVEYIAHNPSKFGIENITGTEAIGEYIAENKLYVHPTFFYESVWCILGFFVLFIILKKYRKFSGQLFLCYGLWYGFERLIVEGMRTDSLYVGNTGLRVSQLVSLALVTVCGALLITLTVKYTRHPKPIEGLDYFPPKTEKELLAEKKKLERKLARKNSRQLKIEDGRPVLKNSAERHEEKPVKEASFDENERSSKS